MSRLGSIATVSVVITLATVTVARSALSQPTTPPSTYYALCWSPPNKQLVYVSAPFQTSEPRNILVETEFKAFLKKQYGYSANDAQCSGDGSASIRDSKRAQILKQVQQLDGELTTVSFTYTPAAQATGAAPAPAAAPAPTLGANLNPGNLKDPWLQKAKDELKGSAGWCSTNVLLHQIFDCDCFARLVFQFRVAHAGEYKESHREEGTGWNSLTSIVYAKDFVCTECLEDVRLTKYVHDELLSNNQPAITMGRTTAAKVNARADCVAPKYIAEFKAHPHVYEATPNFNRANEACPP